MRGRRLHRRLGARACPTGRPRSSRSSTSSCRCSPTGLATTITAAPTVRSPATVALSSADDAKLYLFDDLGVSQRWTNKFSEVGIETVGRPRGQERGGSAAHRRYRREGDDRGAARRPGRSTTCSSFSDNNDDVADEEDLSQLLQMVFSPDGPDDILLGTSAPQLTTSTPTRR